MGGCAKSGLRRLYLRLLLLQTLLLHLCYTAAWSFGALAEVYMCDQRHHPLFILLNSSIDVCCQLSETECDRTSFGDQLTLRPDQECRECWDNLTQVDECTIRMLGFRLESPTMKKIGRLRCFKNDTQLSSRRYEFIEPPARPSIENVTFRPRKNITVIFDRGKVQDNWRDLYNVSMTEYGKTTTLCQDITFQAGQQQYRCHYNWPAVSTPGDNTLMDCNVTITIAVQRAAAPVIMTQGEYRVMEHIIPSPVMKLAVQPNVTEAIVTFCNHKGMSDIYEFMDLVGQPLHYHVRTVHTQDEGVPEEVQLVVTMTQNLTKCLGLRLPQLTPDTSYTVEVWGSGGGGEGDRRNMEFTTNKSVPTEPPPVDSSNFLVVVNSTEQSEHAFGLELMWQALPKRARGGANITYVIEVHDSNGDLWANTTTAETWAFFKAQAQPDDPLTAKIWAQNELGRSANFAEIKIPSSHDVVKPKINVEFVGDFANVFIHLPDGEEFTSLAVHHCLGYKDYGELEVDICQMPPTTEIYPTSQVGQPIHLLLAKPDDDPPERWETRNVTFYKLKGLNQPLADAEMGVTEAKVLLYPPASELEVQDFENHDYKEEVDFYYMYYDYDSRRKRAIKRRQETVYRKIFVSLQVNGLWQGMVSAGCYFDRSLDTIDVSLWQEPNDANPDSVLLKWKQHCSPARAENFLANHYEVFSTSDQETCDTGSPKQVQVINYSQCFQPMQVSVEKSSKFVCLTAFKNTMDVHKTFQYEISQQKGSQVTKESMAGVEIGVSLAVVFLVVIICGFLVCYCRKKSNYFNKLVAKTKTEAPVEMSPPQEQDSPPPLPMPREIMPDKIIINSGTGSPNTTDSGRVSDFNGDSSSGSQQEGKVNRAFNTSDSETSQKSENIGVRNDYVRIHHNSGPDGASEANSISDHSGSSDSQGDSEGNMTGSDPWPAAGTDIDREQDIDLMQRMEAAKHGLTLAPQTSGDSRSSSDDRRETSVERNIDLKQKAAAEKAGLTIKDLEEEGVSDEGRWRSEDVTPDRCYSDNNTCQVSDYISLPLDPSTNHHILGFGMADQNKGRQFKPAVYVINMAGTYPSQHPPSSSVLPY